MPGDAHDVALDRFGNLWFTDRARSALGVWDGRRLTELRVQRRPRPQLEDIVLGGGGSLNRLLDLAAIALRTLVGTDAIDEKVWPATRRSVPSRLPASPARPGHHPPRS